MIRYLASLLLLVSCRSLVIDHTINAAYAGDHTLIVNACGAIAQGGTICRLREGEKIVSGVDLIVPVGGAILGGEVQAIYKDLAPQTFGIVTSVVSIPFSQVMGEGTWSRKEHDGDILLLATIRYKAEDNIERTTKAIGYVKLLVLDPKYDGVVGIDSGFIAWKQDFKCTVAYTTAGRSAIKCR